jgi:hypothetical protein
MSQLLYEGEAQKADLLQDDLIDVQEVSYLRNEKATFCMRPTEMVDTIVIHHSETPPTSTPKEINDYHVDRNRDTKDPWYMIAYSFVINSPYDGMDLPVPKASVGRPFEIVGAHTGSNIFVPMDAVQSKLWAEKKIVCGNKTEMKFNPALVKNKKIKANVTTIGIVVIGNYAAYDRVINPGGYNASIETRNPSLNTIDMVARLSCQLQKKYPRIKNLTHHSNYHSTSCPGNFYKIDPKKNNMVKVQQKAKEYGCDFNLLSKH